MFVRAELFPLSDGAVKEELVKDRHRQQARAPAVGLRAPERHSMWDSPVLAGLGNFRHSQVEVYVE